MASVAPPRAQPRLLQRAETGRGGRHLAAASGPPASPRVDFPTVMVPSTASSSDKAPGVLVRITGQPPLAATVYQLQKLRGHLCGQVFTAATPEAAGEQNYDATAGSMIGLLKYGSGLPFNRLDGLQGDLDVPLPASTQWDIVQAVAVNIKPAIDELIRQAVQGEALHNDVTTVKILELMENEASKRPGRCRGRRGRRRSDAGACTLRAWWRCAMATGSRCSSAATGTRAKTWRRSSSTVPSCCRRRSRCVMPFREPAGRVADDPGALPGPCPAAVCRCLRLFSRAVPPPS